MNGIWYIIGILTATALAAACLAPALAVGARRFVGFRGHRAAFALLIVGLAIYAGAKHGGVPIVEKPVWMTATAVADTNTWTSATFTIAANGIVPEATPLYIDAARSGQSITNWQTLVSTTWGERPGSVSFASLSPSNPTNYICRVRCDYSPVVVAITDFSALAAITDRFVTCTFTATTNLVGQTAIVEVLDGREVTEWRQLGTLTVATNNTFVIRGNFISRGDDRRFRVRVNGEIIGEGADE